MLTILGASSKEREIGFFSDLGLTGPKKLDNRRYRSCFISYSGKDESFVRRLRADLLDKGVSCWFAPHDMPIGAKILDAIDEADHG